MDDLQNRIKRVTTGFVGMQDFWGSEWGIFEPALLLATNSIPGNAALINGDLSGVEGKG